MFGFFIVLVVGGDCVMGHGVLALFRIDTT
jgi:hypothetical protein